MASPANGPATGRSVNKDWLRALQRTAQIGEKPHEILAEAIDAVAARHGDKPAILSATETLTFDDLVSRMRRYARWAQSEGLRKGDTVALMVEGQPDYVAIWMGLNRIGVIVALINTNLTGDGLAHCLRVCGATCAIVSPVFADICRDAAPDLPHVLHDAALAQTLAAYADAPLDLEDADRPIIADRALYIYTSGTTGLPKAAIVTHRRIMNWALWFGGLADVTAQDRVYDCLPLYHSVGGVVAIFTPLLAGGSVYLREKFSVSAFWTDIVENDCTMFQYIGELCRYLLHAPPREEETRHRLRLVLGNGLRPEVWEKFVARFNIPRVLEFYAATESNFSLYNVEGEPGAIGRIPSFLAAHQQLRLVRYDAAADAPMRGEDGFCVACAADEPGEAIARIAAKDGADFDGYLDRVASEKKILRDVFAPGDAWMRSGDLMRRDARGFYYFVDRVGDTFRWKGENVATAEVAQALAAFPGVLDVNVYGVEIPGRDGRAGMAALVVDDRFEIAALRAHVAARLPAYARPLFVRLSPTLAVTETFKHKKLELSREGFNPKTIDAPLYFAAFDSPIYVPLDAALYERIVSGAAPL